MLSITFFPLRALAFISCKTWIGYFVLVAETMVGRTAENECETAGSLRLKGEAGSVFIPATHSKAPTPVLRANQTPVSLKRPPLPSWGVQGRV